MQLGNRRTIKGFKIKKKEYNKLCYLKHIANKEDIITSELFATRNIDVKDVDNFLNPKLRNLLPKVGFIKDIEKASKRIVDAIINNEKVCIYGDYDVDGLTSTSLMILYLKECGLKVDYYIPDRITEGYGPNSNAIEKIKNNQNHLIIFVDCGATAYEPLETAKKINIDVIVLDHHKTDEKLPYSLAQVNPNRLDETEINEELHSLCACSVVFLTLMYCNKLLKELQENKQLQKKYNIPDLIQFTPLVAFATICDVMNLTMLNRAFIKTGLSVLEKNKTNNKQSFNLYYLLKINNEQNTNNNSNKQLKITAYSFGFTLGPMVNAGGRIGKGDLGVKLMIEENDEKAQIIANELLLLNSERKNIEQNSLNEISKTYKNQIENQIKENGFVFLYNKNWHEGIIGLIASRVKDKYNYPVIIGSETEKEIVKCSSRSVNGVDIGNIILEAKQKNLIENGGGHKLAGGFSIKTEKILSFINFMKEKTKKDADKSFEEKTIEYTTEISLSGLTFNLLEKIEKFEPFGVGNPKPIFLLKDVKILDVRVIKDKHISLIIEDNDKTAQAMAFNIVRTELGLFLLSSKNKVINMLITANIDIWNNDRRISIFIEDCYS